jgi:hypothetical protein
MCERLSFSITIYGDLEGAKFRASIPTVTFGTRRMAELSAVNAGNTLLLRKFLDTHLCQRLSRPQSY